MNIALVDDDQEELFRLSELIERQASCVGMTIKRIDRYHSGEAFLADFTAECYDLILLDIFMDRKSGIDVARKIRETDGTVCLVFASSSNEFASESYEVSAHDYLLKPFTEKRVANMLKKLNPEEYELGRAVILPDGQRIVLRNIICTEYYNHTVTIYNKQGGAVKTRISQTELQGILLRYPYFCCCFKGMIVNFYEVSRKSEDVFFMNGGKTVPISRRRGKEVRDAYTKFRFERLRKEMLK